MSAPEIVDQALDAACQNLATAGNLSTAVREEARKVGVYVNAGRIDHGTALNDLLDAALSGQPEQSRAQLKPQIIGMIEGQFNAAPRSFPNEDNTGRKSALASNLGIMDRQQLNQIPPLSPMIGQVLDKGVVAMLAAQPAAGKSFLGIDWACSYITGRNWHGHDVDNTVTYPDDKPAPGDVLYIAGEGARGLAGRVAAWEAAWRMEVPADRFHVLPKPVQLGNLNEVAMLCAHLEEETYGLVIVDTVARCSLGLEENSASDMGRIIDALYQIRGAMGPDGTVLAIHHQGKSGVVRGSSALLGGVDQLMGLERDGDTLELKDEKRKDGMELAPMNLRLAAKFDSCIIEAVGPDWQETNPLVELMGNQLAALLPMPKGDLKAAAGLGDRAFFLSLNRGLQTGHILATNEKNPRYGLGNGDL